MIPKMNMRQMQRAMQRMGVKQQEIEAKEVIIKTSDKDLIIKNPQVVKVNMMGQETFQISGTVEEATSISEEDIKTVAEQAKVSTEEARESLKKNGGDLAKSILELTTK